MPKSIDYTNGLSNACADLIARGAPADHGKQRIRPTGVLDNPIMAARDGTKISGGRRLGRHSNQRCLI